ncbi:hypothetical protein OG21DRAFT_1490393 [Imleria badia]|nr:hypothetical protein OG21DRAFT_1490393 [Imleria badia]
MPNPATSQPTDVISPTVSDLNAITSITLSDPAILLTGDPSSGLSQSLSRSPATSPAQSLATPPVPSYLATPALSFGLTSSIPSLNLATPADLSSHTSSFAFNPAKSHGAVNLPLWGSFMNFVHGNDALLPDLTFGNTWNDPSLSSQLPGIDASNTMSLGDLDLGLPLCMGYDPNAGGFQPSVSNMSQLDVWPGSNFLPLGTFGSTNLNSGFDLNFGGIPNYMAPRVLVPSTSTNLTSVSQLPIPSSSPQLTLTMPQPAIGMPPH